MSTEPKVIASDAGGAGLLPEGFAELPTQVYAGDPRWIPEEIVALAPMFSRHNPWFRRGRARLFSLPGQARAAAFFDPEALVDGKRSASFGYWESQASAAVDRTLFAALVDWARAQGAESLVGPINFSTMGANRILVESSVPDLPFLGEPYNPLDYAARLRGCGFEQVQSYGSFFWDRAASRRMIESLGTGRRQLLDAGYRFESLTPELWMDNLPAFAGLLNLIFADNLAFTPVSVEEFRLACGPSFIRKACPATSILARDPKGAIAGFLLIVPNWGPIVTQGAGAERVAVSDVDHALHATLLARLGGTTGICKSGGVTPESRSRGLYGALLAESFERGDALYDTWIGATVREGNRSGNVLAREGVTGRRYGLYARAL